VSASASTRRHETRAESDHKTVTVNDRFVWCREGFSTVQSVLKIIQLRSTERGLGRSGGNAGGAFERLITVDEASEVKIARWV